MAFVVSRFKLDHLLVQVNIESVDLAAKMLVELVYRIFNVYIFMLLLS